MDNYNRKKAILIGDTLHDFEVACALGIHCVLIANGHQSKERLVDFTGDKTIVLDDITQLNNLF